MGARWLITGSQGFVGRYATAYVLNSDLTAQVVGLGRSSEVPGFFSHCISTKTGMDLAPLPEDVSACFDHRYSYFPVDLQDEAALLWLFKYHRPHFVLHLASGLRGDDKSALAGNIVHANTALMRAVDSRLNEPLTIVLGSSCGVYGTHPEHRFPLTETEQCYPQDEYSIAKFAAEQRAQAIAAGTNMQLIITRIFNIIGPGQDERHLAGSLAPRIARLSSQGQKELTVGRIDVTRDFIDVWDVVRALVELARHPDASGVINVASGHPVRVSELCESFLRISGARLTLTSSVLADAGVLRSWGSILRLQKHGITPRVTLDESIRRVIAYYKRVWE